MTNPTDHEIGRMAALFEGCAEASGTHGLPERDASGKKWTIKKTAITLPTQAPTLAIWRQHLLGNRPLGCIPIRRDSMCRWGSIDYDEYDDDILEIVRKCEDSGLPLVPCRSKSGGVHLFLFLKEYESAERVQAVLRDAAASMGLSGCEIFPKQTKILADRGDVGNWMIAPYFGGDYDGKLKMQYGMKSSGAEMALEEFLRVAESRKTTVEDVYTMLENKKTNSNVVKLRRNSKNGKAKNDFSNGPPCLQHLFTAKTTSEGRKRTLFNAATYFKKCNENGWKESLEEANTQFDPPLPSEEVSGIIRSQGKKDYEYQCKEEPLRSHCNSTLCKMRKYGVGVGGEYPEISNISRLDSEPVMWFVDVAGTRLEIGTDQLQHYIKFHAVCLEKTTVGYPMIPQKVWMSILGEAMRNLTILPVPPNTGFGARFYELLEEFLTNRAKGDRPEDILSGRPWEDADELKHYFRIRDLQKFLTQEGVRDMSRAQMVRRIERLGEGKHGTKDFTINGREIHTYWVSSQEIRGHGPIPTPKFKGEEI